MKIFELNERDIINERKNDLIERGKNCLVYNYRNQIVRLNDCEIWYNNKWKYVKPKKFIPKYKEVQVFYHFFKFN